MGFIQGFSEDAFCDFAIYSLGLHLNMAIKSWFFYCKYWKPHVSSSIRSWDIAFLSLGLINIKSTFESPSETMLGTLGQSLLIEKWWLQEISLTFNGVFLMQTVSDWHLAVVSIHLWHCGFSLWSLILENRHRWVCKRSIWPCMAWFHGDLLVWCPSY